MWLKPHFVVKLAKKLMQFCPKCGGILLPKKEGNNTIMKCMKCNYKSKDVETTTFSEKIKEKTKVEVVDEEQDFSHLPLVEEECPKCKSKKAYHWSIQTRASDEPETKFFKCKKCKHTWRDYS